MAARSSRTLVWILFNASWDRVVGNTIDQLHRPRGAGDDGTDGYVEYLAHALESLVRTGGPAGAGVEISLVELDRTGLSLDGLRRAVEARVPGLGARFSSVGLPVAQPFLDEAQGVPLTAYRSPNRLHEALMFRRLQSGAERYIGFLDPDVTFVRPGAGEAVFDLLAKNPHAWAAGFLERSRPRPWRGGWVPSRERMHSVAAFFDADAMRRNFPIEPFTKPTPVDARMALLRDPEARAYYRQYAMLDTFNLLTDYLRANWSVDRLLALDEHVGCALEGERLTIVSDLLVHCKYRDPESAGTLAAALDRSGLRSLGLPEVARLELLCGRPR